MQMVGPWGRYLPQWLRAPGNGSGPAICQHTHTHTLDLTHHNVCFRDPIRYTCQLCIPNTHMHAGPYTYCTLCISAKRTHNKGSRTQPIMSTLMPRSGIPVICSRAALSCDSSYFFCCIPHMLISTFVFHCCLNITTFLVSQYKFSGLLPRLDQVGNHRQVFSKYGACDV